MIHWLNKLLLGSRAYNMYVLKKELEAEREFTTLLVEKCIIIVGRLC